ncbi:MAG: FmdB family zinc ribbon protein, partial [Desulfatirhabdiaceae bacterium]
MPIYDISCRACGKNSEVLVIRSDDSLICPDCGSPAV